MFTIGKTYQIVLNTDLDGNTLPFPHTMVGTCLSFDKEYATFLDPMTNLVRGMKIQQGDPKLKDSTCKPKTPTAPSVASKSILQKASTSLFKKTEPTAVPKTEVPKAAVPKTEVPKAEVPKAEVPKATASKDKESVANLPVPKEIKLNSGPYSQQEPGFSITDTTIQNIITKVKEHLASKETTFTSDLTYELEPIKSLYVLPPNKKYVYSFTGGFEKNPFDLGTGNNPIGVIQSKYKKKEETCFFLFNTKQLLDKPDNPSGLFFLVALPTSECDQYTTKKISFQSTDTTPVK